MSQQSALCVFEVQVPEDESISTWPSCGKGLFLFDRRTNGSIFYTVVTTLERAKKLKEFLKSKIPSITVQGVSGIESILKEGSNSSSENINTIVFPIGSLLTFNQNISSQDVSYALGYAITKINEAARLGLVSNDYKIAVRFFQNKKTSANDGCAYVNFEDVEESVIAVLVYVLRKMKWNLFLNEMDPNRNRHRMYCFPKSSSKKEEIVHDDLPDDSVSEVSEIGVSSYTPRGPKKDSSEQTTKGTNGRGGRGRGGMNERGGRGGRGGRGSQGRGSGKRSEESKEVKKLEEPKEIRESERKGKNTKYDDSDVVTDWSVL